MWKVELRSGILWRVVNTKTGRVWGANKGCSEAEANAICNALNSLEDDQVVSG